MLTSVFHWKGDLMVNGFTYGYRRDPEQPTSQAVHHEDSMHLGSRANFSHAVSVLFCEISWKPLLAFYLLQLSPATFPSLS